MFSFGSSVIVDTEPFRDPRIDSVMLESMGAKSFVREVQQLERAKGREEA